MRLIDADALMNDLNYANDLSIDAWKTVKRIVTLQETVPLERRFGKWKQVPAGMSPGGTPCFACGNCGGSDHLHGAEYQKRKIICDCCGQINIYPFEKAYEEGSSLWPMQEPPKEAT